MKIASENADKKPYPGIVIEEHGTLQQLTQSSTGAPADDAPFGFGFDDPDPGSG